LLEILLGIREDRGLWMGPGLVKTKVRRTVSVVVLSICFWDGGWPGLYYQGEARQRKCKSSVIDAQACFLHTLDHVTREIFNALLSRVPLFRYM